MIGCPVCCLEGTPLQLGRSVFSHAHQGAIGGPFVRKLKGVGVDHRDQRLVKDHDAGMVDVTDHASGCMDRRDSGWQVQCSPDEEPDIGVRELLTATARTVKIVNGPVSGTFFMVKPMKAPP